MSTKWNEGFSRNPGQSVPVVATDCSSWEADVPAELWSEGFSLNAHYGCAQPPTYGTAHAKPLAAISISLTYSDTVDRELMAPRINSVVGSIKQLDPSLGLEYDEVRSQQDLDAREVKIVLAPVHDMENLADRVWDLLGRVRKLELKSLAIQEPLTISFNCLQAA
jgi:hypothetical protein